MTDQDYRDFDEVCANSIYYLVDRIHERKSLSLIGLNPDDPNHMFVYSVARIAAGITNTKLGVDMRLIEFLKFKHRFVNTKQLIRREGNINVGDTVDILCSNNSEILGPHRHLADVYQEYYAERKEE